MNPAKQLATAIGLGFISAIALYLVVYFTPEIDHAANGNPFAVALLFILVFGYIGIRWAMWYVKNH